MSPSDAPRDCCAAFGRALALFKILGQAVVVGGGGSGGGGEGSGGVKSSALQPWSKSKCVAQDSAILVAISYYLVPPTYPESRDNPPLGYLKLLKPRTSVVQTVGEIISRNRRKAIHEIVRQQVVRPKWIERGTMLEWTVVATLNMFSAALRLLASRPSRPLRYFT